MSDEKQTLEDIYYERMMTEPIGLREFMQEVEEGKHGSFSVEERKDFLLKMEQVYIENIYLKAQEVPGLQNEIEERIEETRTYIQDLIKRFVI